MSEPTRLPQPLILIRGFGGLDISEEKKDTYQRFNVGTVYPQKQGENYIYEGMVLRLIKSDWKYQDATNVVGYYGKAWNKEPLMPERLKRSTAPGVVEKFQRWQELGYFSGNKIVIAPDMALYLLETVSEPLRTIWVFRYYDLDERKFELYGEALVRLIDFIRELTVQLSDNNGQNATIAPKVNIIAHSMGGLIVREAIQNTYPSRQKLWQQETLNSPEKPATADESINKIITLGTPHRGITFQILKNWINIPAEKELERFNPELQENENNPESYKHFGKHFPLERLLTVVGTNYRSYDNQLAALANRLFPMPGEYGSNYNKSDGLVKQTSAQIPGAPRTFVHKCHGGNDSLITSREAFEIATRFFFGNVRVRLRLLDGKITRGKDFFGKSEFFLGISIKPRGVDFELFHQSKAAENCYGPFMDVDFREKPEELSFSWADAEKENESKKLIWEGFLDTNKCLASGDMVMRLEFYVGERDLYGIGFSDTIIFHEQYYVRVLLPTAQRPEPLLYLHADERFAAPGFAYSATDKPMEKLNGGWTFEIGGTELGFKGMFGIEVDKIPDVGEPVAFVHATKD